jgi:hypothetical protein
MRTIPFLVCALLSVTTVLAQQDPEPGTPPPVETFTLPGGPEVVVSTIPAPPGGFPQVETISLDGQPFTNGVVMPTTTTTETATTTTNTTEEATQDTTSDEDTNAAASLSTAGSWYTTAFALSTGLLAILGSIRV